MGSTLILKFFYYFAPIAIIWLYCCCLAFSIGKIFSCSYLQCGPINGSIVVIAAVFGVADVVGVVDVAAVGVGAVVVVVAVAAARKKIRICHRCHISIWFRPFSPKTGSIESKIDQKKGNGLSGSGSESSTFDPL